MLPGASQTFQTAVSFCKVFYVTPVNIYGRHLIKKRFDTDIINHK